MSSSNIVHVSFLLLTENHAYDVKTDCHNNSYRLFDMSLVRKAKKTHTVLQVIVPQLQKTICVKITYVPGYTRSHPNAGELQLSVICRNWSPYWKNPGRNDDKSNLYVA